MSCLLCVKELSKRFSPHGPAAVDQVTFEVEANEILVLVGPSGCGKTTTLRVIAGYERADGGCVDLDGQCIERPDLHVPPQRRKFGFVFQDYALFPHMSVVENVCYALHSWARRDRKPRAMQLLKMVGMDELADRRPQDLSGGQQQRVALARSIAPEPKLILLDEPFSNLDAGLRQTMRHDFKRLLRRNRMSAVLVTHDQEEALSFADRIGVMNEGRIEQTGEPADVYLRPRTPFVASFLGGTNLLPATAEDGRPGGGERGPHRGECPLGSIRLDRAAAGQVTVAIRPEHLKFEHLYPGQPAGQIIRREFKGHDLTYTVAFGEYLLTVQTDYACSYAVGQSVRVVPVEAAVVLEAGAEGKDR